MGKELNAAAYAAATTPEEKLTVINQVSYLKTGEAAFLYGLYCEAHGAGGAAVSCIEIGARYGCSTLALALANSACGGTPIVSIDPHLWPIDGAGRRQDSISYLARNLGIAGLGHCVQPILALSNEVATWWATPTNMLWIDGDHSTEAVMSDLENWACFVIPGGIICGHDYMDNPPTVKRAVDAFAEHHGRRVEVVGSVWVLRDREPSHEGG